MAVELVTPAEYARRRGVSSAAVKKAIDSGRISTIEGKIDPDVANIQWKRNTRPRADYHVGAVPASSSPADTGDEDPHRSRMWEYREQRERAEAQLKQLELAQALGNLVEVAEVERIQFALARAVRDSLLSMPDRLAPLLAANSSIDECRRMLDEELRAVLTQLAESADIDVDEKSAAA